MDTRVLNDSREHVLNDCHEIVGQKKPDGEKVGDHKEMVYRDEHRTVHRHQIEQIGGNLQLLVGGIDGEGNQDIVVKGTKKETIDGNRHLHVKGDRLEQVDGDQSLTVQGDIQATGGGNLALELARLCSSRRA